MIAKFLPALEAIEVREGKGFTPELWMERPKKSRGACKFEIANGRDNNRRDEIAESIRVHLQAMRLPEGTRWSTGSTVISCPVGEIDDSAEANSNRNVSQVQRVMEFVKFLDAGVLAWVEKYKAGL